MGGLKYNLLSTLLSSVGIRARAHQRSRQDRPRPTDRPIGERGGGEVQFQFRFSAGFRSFELTVFFFPGGGMSYSASTQNIRFWFFFLLRILDLTLFFSLGFMHSRSRGAHTPTHPSNIQTNKQTTPNYYGFSPSSSSSTALPPPPQKKIFLIFPISPIPILFHSSLSFSLFSLSFSLSLVHSASGVSVLLRYRIVAATFYHHHLHLHPSFPKFFLFSFLPFLFPSFVSSFHPFFLRFLLLHPLSPIIIITIKKSKRRGRTSFRERARGVWVMVMGMGMGNSKS